MSPNSLCSSLTLIGEASSPSLAEALGTQMDIIPSLLLFFCLHSEGSLNRLVHILDSSLTSTYCTPFGATTKNVATQVLQGTGEAAVDLNRYNLESLDTIEQEWTATLVQKVNENTVKPKLAAQSARELYVDTIQVSFPRSAGGLGLELVELAGGRDDGLGITVVSNVLPEGAAAQATPTPILPGDSIAQVSVVQQSRQGLADSETEVVVQTECLSYDATVAAIQSLPPPSTGNDEYYALTLKRLRRKPKVTVKLQFPEDEKEKDATLELFAGENLRHGMLVRGVKLNDPLAQRFDTKNGGNCGAGGLCRTCAVAVQSGAELLNPQRVAEQQMLADNPRWRLACKAIVGYGMQEGEMTVRVTPRQW
ncbi:Ferredoxin [Seminavis robusta]|uniref:Ferredoxin n=1 Tax=Seminavis robusta TaxID=568900 RepID=A0A9N8EIB6_9STRA|nr:Ferredoxin [Seminavis robusta]|eukprot:Sro1146_g246290.1 Ferredoxin (366) ;mRNA; r:4615-5806